MKPDSFVNQITQAMKQNGVDSVDGRLAGEQAKAWGILPFTRDEIDGGSLSLAG